ncbi:hypothetical protein LTR53_015021 [Teratosphaeriaceae sp. CCFEE 6253]|nr:hypothetical protein LTR53_015021 [Teratosphaeriaceae sp. CCFEE 6253]
MGAKRKQPSSPASSNSRKRARASAASSTRRRISTRSTGRTIPRPASRSSLRGSLSATPPSSPSTSGSIERRRELGRRSVLSKRQHLRPRCQPGRGRLRKVIDSSPEVPLRHYKKQKRYPEQKQPAPVNTQAESSPVDTTELEIIETQPTEDDELNADSPLFEPIIEPSDPPSSYIADKYQRFLSSSQAGTSSEAVLLAASSAPVASGKQPRSVPDHLDEGSSRVIPDSQTFVDLTSPPPAAFSSTLSEAQAKSPTRTAVFAHTSPVVENNLDPVINTRGESTVTPRQPSETAEPKQAVLLTQLQDAAAAGTIPAVTSAEQGPSSAWLHTTSTAVQPCAQADPVLAPVGTETTAPEASPAAPLQTPLKSHVAVASATETESRASEAAIKTVAELIGVNLPTKHSKATDSSTSASQIGGSGGTGETDRRPPSAVAQIDGQTQNLPQSLEDQPDFRAARAGAQSTSRKLGEPALYPASIPIQPSPGHGILTSPSTFPLQTQLPRPSSDDISPRASLPSGSPTTVPPMLGKAATRAAEAASLQETSPIASVPSNPIGTIGESAPPLPDVPSSPSIATGSSSAVEMSQGPGDAKVSLGEKLARLREGRQKVRQASVQATASLQCSSPSAATSKSSVVPPPPKFVSSLIADEQDRRSPSAIPAVQPHEVASQEDMNTSERYGTLLPQTHPHAMRNGSISGNTGSERPLEVQDPHAYQSYVVPITLLGHQRDQYASVAERDLQVLERFLETSTPDLQLTRDAERFIQQKRQIALHPDLVNGETMTPYDVRPEQEAQWYIDCSAKFRFLKELLDDLRDHTLHITIVTQPGRILDMLETFLSGISVPCNRTGGVSSAGMARDEQGLKVTLVSAGDTLPQPPSSASDLVIALDPTARAECATVQALTRGERKATLVTLVVPKSIEHLEHSISTTLPDHTRLRMLMTGFNQYRQEAGKLDEGQLALTAAAKALAQHLAHPDTYREWPLVNLPALNNLDSQTESDIELPTTQHEPSLDDAGSMKRSLDAEDNVASEQGPAKKARLELAAQDVPVTVNLQDVEVTHISDSVTKPTQSGVDDAMVRPGLLSNDAEQILRRVLGATQGRLDEHVQSLSQVQYRYEELRQKLVLVTMSRDDVVMTAQGYLDRAAKAESRLLALRADYATMKQQFADAHVRLLDHSVPERAEMERFRAEMELAEAEKAQMAMRLDRLNKEHEYLRDTYQTSSQGAQALASQVTELQNSLSAAQSRATGEQVKLRQMGYDARTINLQLENRKLKGVLKERDASVRMRDEEIARLKEASRGRMGTRGTSVPRSPRLGSPMKMAEPIRGTGSRQGSPAAGDLRMKGGAHLHPLRNG